MKTIQEKWKENVDVPADRVFVGLDAYQKAIDCGVDMVVMATPPGFRPLHYAAAVKAGKNIFMEKPLCTDAPGYRQLVEANELADKKRPEGGCRPAAPSPGSVHPGDSGDPRWQAR